MKKKLHFLSLLICLCSLSANAQDTLWKEGFTRGGVSNFPVTSGTAAASPGQYYISSAGLTWYGYGLYNANSSQNCTNAAGNNDHIRLLGATTPDSAFIVTPVANWAGINRIGFKRNRTNKRYTFYWTSDTLATTTNWIFAAHLPAWGYPTCTDTFVTINQMSARRVKIAIQSNNDTDIDSMYQTTIRILPIVFSGANAYTKEAGVQIEWSSSREINTHQYIIERSGNGNDFRQIAVVAASGNSNSSKKYYLFDAHPLLGINLYRIKVLDADGQFMYSSVLKVNTSSSKVEISVAPNPIKDGVLNIQLSSLTKGSYSIKLFNNVGQLVLNTQLSTDGGSLSQSFTLPSTVKAGMYNLQLSGGDVKISKRVVVQ